MGYRLPSDTDWVTANHYNHCCERNPPSSEPGTDYGSGYGSPLYAVGTGTVVDLSHSNGGGTGRYIAIDMDDGRRARSLHLSEVWVNVGQRVNQGDRIGSTGASGWGSDWGYGAHVHQTLWDYWGYDFCSWCTLDFELYVGSAVPGPTQRQVLSTAQANRRGDPSTANPPLEPALAPNTIADFNGWISGESVSGNNVWFRGALSGDFFWSGGFTDTSTHDLADLNQPDPGPPDGTPFRTVGVNPSNIRDLPYTASPVIGSVDGGLNVELSGYTHAESIDGNDIWFERAADRDWMWSGGFTDAQPNGLAEVPTPNPPAPTDPDNPRGLPVETGYQWPLAQIWLNAPLGHIDCQDLSSAYASRSDAGGIPMDAVLDTYVIHWTDTGTDDAAATDWHSHCNSRSSAPTTQINRDGSQTQFIRVGAKPAATGPDWNWRSFAVETVGGPGNDFTPEQWETHAQNIAELARNNGKLIDGVLVEFTIDRDHIFGHRELDGQEGTECPGDAQIAGLDDLIVRAQEILDGDVPPPDGGGVLNPNDYPELYATHLELGQAFGDSGAQRTRR